jgi:hypothetical protein
VSPIAKASTRFGLGHGALGGPFEKSTRWSGKKGDVGAPQYLLKPLRSEQETQFGSSTREDWGRIMGTIPKTNPNAGPGSYEISMLLMPTQPRVKFGNATRPSMALNTLSPGPIYEVEGKFKDGPVSGKIKPGFNLDHRKDMATSSTDAMYHPKLETGKSCTLKARRVPSLLRANQMRGLPAPHDYDVVGSSAILQAAPAFTFFKGPARFKDGDRVTMMMKQLEDQEKMMAFMTHDLPSVSSQST